MTNRSAITRYLIVAAIILVIGGAFIGQQALDDDDGTIGMIDRHDARVGSMAPDFMLESLPDGELVRLSDFRGKTVVLNFWASWCPPCRQEFPELQAIQTSRQATDDLVVLAVDFKQDAGDVQKFVDEFGATFPVLMDRTGRVTDHYGSRGIPRTYFIDAAGVVRHVQLGPVFGGLLSEGVAIADAGGGDAEPEIFSREKLDQEGGTGEVVLTNGTEIEVTVVTNGAKRGTLAPGAEMVIGQYEEGAAFGRVIALDGEG